MDTNKIRKPKLISIPMNEILRRFRNDKPITLDVDSISRQDTKRLHLPFLDGLRGLTAFYVLLFHILADGEYWFQSDLFLMNFLRFGREAVAIFIVLSGFVLSLPLARSNQIKLYGGFGGYIRRRARRILPAYYPALFLLPLFYFIVELLKTLSGDGGDWLRIREMVFSMDMLSHLFLLHNLSPDWIFSYNPVLWSLSTEWWIYIVFALVLVPIWRRTGILYALVVSLFLSLLPLGLEILGLPTIYGSPHLLGAFGLGMACAVILFSKSYQSNIEIWQTILSGLLIVFFISFIWISIAFPEVRIRTDTQWIPDLLIALVSSTIILMIATSEVFQTSKNSITRAFSRILQSRPLGFLGAFSYSIYLTHLAFWTILGTTLNLAPVQNVFSYTIDPFPIRIFIVIPLFLLGAYCFYFFFEKPFIHKK